MRNTIIDKCFSIRFYKEYLGVIRLRVLNHFADLKEWIKYFDYSFIDIRICPFLCVEIDH